MCLLVQETLCGTAQTIEDIIPTLERVQRGQLSICVKGILVNEETWSTDMYGVPSILSLHHLW